MSWKYLNKKTYSDSRLYSIINKPIISEKTTIQSSDNKYVFEVSKDSNKFEIKAAIEKIFGVTVVSISTSILKGKTKRFKGIMGKRVDIKKAVVTLKDGDSIDFESTV